MVQQQQRLFFLKKAKQYKEKAKHVLQQIQTRTLTPRQEMQLLRSLHEEISTVTGNEPDDYYDGFRKRNIRPTQRLVKLYDQLTKYLPEFQRLDQQTKERETTAIQQLQQLKDKIYDKADRLFTSMEKKR